MSVLVLGGTEFMGRCVVDALVAAQPAIQVAMFNRGKRHWGDVNRHATVTHIRGDRHDAPAFAAALRARRWTAIVDFTCFNARDLAPVLEYGASAEASPRLLYVFVSSDSVYQVCKVVPGVPALETHDERRQIDPATEPFDEYGAGKWDVEQALRASTLRSVALRLPDVLGPFDNTHRFWCYHMWLPVSARVPVLVTPHTDAKQLSFVYSEDVARLVVLLIQQDAAVERFRVYNVACTETLSLRAFLHLMAEEAGAPEPTFTAEDDAQLKCKELLPSVDFGPIDASKVLREVPGFQPTPLRDAVRAMVSWFREAWDRFPKEREDAIGELPKALQKLVRRHMAAPQ